MAVLLRIGLYCFSIHTWAFSYVKPVPDALQFDITLAGDNRSWKLFVLNLQRGHCGITKSHAVDSLKCITLKSTKRLECQLTRCHVLVNLHVCLNVGHE